MTTFIFPLQAGGGPAVIWCWMIAGIGALCLAFSIAEVASAYPTSGGYEAVALDTLIVFFCPSFSYYVLCLTLVELRCHVLHSEVPCSS